MSTFGRSPATRLQAMFADACFGVESQRAFDGDLQGYLARHAIAKDDAEAILASPRRLGLYRQLVRHNVVYVIRQMLERSRVRLEALAPGTFDQAVETFLEQCGPRTPHLRDVPSEFLEWAAPRWRANASLPAWIVDYAQLELVDFVIGVAPRPAPPPPLGDVAADLPLVFGDPKVMVRLRWAVHLLAPGDVETAPEERPSTLLVYRDAAHRTRYLDLTPLAAAILERLIGGAPLAEALVSACAAEGQVLDQDVLGGAARLLADLGDRGLLLGARARL